MDAVLLINVYRKYKRVLQVDTDTGEVRKKK